MNKTLKISVLCLLLLGAAAACSKQKMVLTPEIAASDEMLYKLGEQSLKRDPEKARIYLRQVIDSFPKSFYAQRAKLAIADSYFNKGDEGSLILASAEYRDFIHSYPFSPSASYAQYRIALTFFKDALKPGRDQTKTTQALAEFKRVITEYPLSEEAKLTQKSIKDCEERLAENNFLIAKHYYRNKAYKACTSRMTEILTTYPNYSHTDQVYYYLADAYYLWGKPQDSIPFFAKLMSDHPRTKLAAKAARRLKDIEADKNKSKK